MRRGGARVLKRVLEITAFRMKFWLCTVWEEIFGFFVLINTCYSAFQKGKEKRKKKKREVEETAANCVKF